jgi:hypothetical protein
MNGEVTMITQDRPNAIAVPNDALRSAGDVQTIAPVLGINLDSMQAQMQAMRRARGAGATTGARGTGGAGGAGRGTAQFVFVKQGNSWIPRRVRIGVSSYDYSEALSGVKEGDVVALPAALLVQQQRDQQTQRIRTVTGNGLPGTSGGARGGGGGRAR